MNKNSPNTNNSSDDLLKKVDETLSHWKTPQKSSKIEVWGRISEEIKSMRLEESNSKTISISKYKYSKIITVAASIILVFGSILFLTSQQTIVTHQNQTASVVLPDGSIVQLQGNSQLDYNKIAFQLGSRQLEFRGEAYFDVAKGKTFEVLVEELGTVQVLGTEFHITSAIDYFKTICTEGKVKVSISKQVTNGGNSHLLLPNERIVYYKNVIKTNSFNEENALQERSKGIYSFENEDFDIVLEDFKRVYGLNIIGNINTNRKYTGFFNTDDLDMAIKLIFEPMGISYQLSDTTLKISE